MVLEEIELLVACDVNALRSGMKVGREVKDMDGKIILTKNTILNAETIQSLIGKNIFSVYVEEVDDNASEMSQHDFLLDNEYIELYKKTFDRVQNIYYTLGRGGELDMNDLNYILDQKNIDELCNGAKAVTQIHNMTRDGDYIIHHATNLGILAGLMSHWMNYSNDKTRELVMTGILCDVGKMKVPKEILNKTGKLSAEEFDTMKRHVDYGYDMLKFSAIQSHKDVLMGILHHHERCDGSGYPNRVKGDNISDFGKIITILDIYDAMAANRSYAKRNSPFDIFQILYEDVLNGKLDTTFGIAFMRRLCHSLNGNWVGLNNGQRAKIVYVDESRVSAMPIVQTTKNEFIDLNRVHDIKIEALLTANEV